MASRKEVATVGQLKEALEEYDDSCKVVIYVTLNDVDAQDEVNSVTLDIRAPDTTDAIGADELLIEVEYEG